MEADEISLDNKSLGEAEQSRNAGQGTGKIMTASDLHATLRRLKLWLIFLACMFAVLLILIVVIGIFTELDGDYLAARISNLEDLAAQQVIWTEKETPPFGYRPAGMPVVVGQWMNGTKMPTPRSDHEALFIEGKFYIVGGTNLIDAVTPTLSSLDIYDPSTDTWTSGPPMPTARYRFAAYAHNNGFFVVGGRSRDDDAVLGSVEEYRVDSNSWLRHKPLTTPRSDMAAAVIGDTLYVMGGYDGDYDALNSTEAYDITSQIWIRGPDMNLARGDIEAVSLDGRVFVAGGYGSAPNYPILNTFESFEPSLNQWVLREPMPTARGDAGMAVFHNQVFVIGGEVATNGLSHPIQTVDAWDPRSQQWSSRAALPIPSFRKSCVGAGEAIFCFGGSTCDNAFVSGCDSAGSDEQITILDVVHKYTEMALFPYHMLQMLDK
jgi:hypothetical protein